MHVNESYNIHKKFSRTVKEPSNQGLTPRGRLNSIIGEKSRKMQNRQVLLMLSLVIN